MRILPVFAARRVTGNRDRFVMKAADRGHSYAFGKFQLSLKNNAEGENPSRTIPTFLALYIFGFLFQLLLVYDALRLKNTIQIIGLCIYNLGLLVYAAVQMDQIEEAVTFLNKKNAIDTGVWTAERPFLIAIPCIIGLGTVLMAVIAWKLYDEFAWTIYKHISADLRLKRRYLTFQVSLQRGPSKRGLARVLTITRFTSLSSSSISSSSWALPFNSSSW